MTQATKVITTGLIYRRSGTKVTKNGDIVTKNLAALNVSIVQDAGVTFFEFDGEQYDLAEVTWDYIKITYEYNEKIDAGIKKDE